MGWDGHVGTSADQSCHFIFEEHLLECGEASNIVENDVTASDRLGYRNGCIRVLEVICFVIQQRAV